MARARTDELRGLVDLADQVGALDLHGKRQRADILISLVSSLLQDYDATEDETFLGEALRLSREALYIRNTDDLNYTNTRLALAQFLAKMCEAHPDDEESLSECTATESWLWNILPESHTSCLVQNPPGRSAYSQASAGRRGRPPK
jgi:hypothetical protein